VVESRGALAELAQHGAALRTGEPVDEELAAQVVGFVLQAAGQLPGTGDHDRLPAKVDAGDHDAGRPRPDRGEASGPSWLPLASVISGLIT
jgi:hypothetical protein